eukprot:scaffold11638_cov74-Skeletonema_dohrnii-CCMP3373.AAC.3
MSDDIFGGSEERWSLAWRWILFYLDERYKNIIDWTSGTVALCGRLPQFYNAIQQKVKQSYICA